MPADLHDDADRLLVLVDVHHIFESQRFEIKFVGRIVIGGNRLRVAVHHDRFVTQLAQGLNGVYTAVIKFDALSDAVRSAAKNHDFLLIGQARLIHRAAVAGIKVGRVSLEFGGAGVHQPVHGLDTRFNSLPTDIELLDVRAAQRRNLAIRKPGPLGFAKQVEIERLVLRRRLQLAFDLHDLRDVVQEPRVNLGDLCNLFHGHALFQGDFAQHGTVLLRLAELLFNIFDDHALLGLQVQPIHADFQAPESFLQRFAHVAADGHRFADRLHADAEARAGAREFLKGETRHFDDAIVECWLKRRRCFARDVVAQFIERVTHSKLGRDFRDGEARGLACQRGTARNTGVHLDDRHASGLWVDCELDV